MKGAGAYTGSEADTECGKNIERKWKKRQKVSRWLLKSERMTFQWNLGCEVRDSDSLVRCDENASRSKYSREKMITNQSFFSPEFRPKNTGILQMTPGLRQNDHLDFLV